jgi:hypothetical protein
MAELADALDLGSNAQKACRFKSCSRHHIHKLFEDSKIRRERRGRAVEVGFSTNRTPP